MALIQVLKPIYQDNCIYNIQFSRMQFIYFEA